MSDSSKSKSTEPWLDKVRGTQVLPIINSDEHVICVEAGPGTGKTFGLVRRVQRILHPDGLNIPGPEVLVVAFNRVIAKQLETEIMEGLKTSSHDGEPRIQTVHAVCLRIIGGALRILLPHERKAMIYDVLTVYPIISNRFPNIYKADQALRDHEANIVPDLPLWQATRQWLVRHGARLISELPKLLLDKIHGGDYGDQTYKYIIVDEYQDLTPGLQELFLKLRKKDGHFMALGDPRQSIYAFLGNEPNGLSNVQKLVSADGETVQQIEMTECQRCPKQIVDASNQLMSLSSSKPMTATSSAPANIHVVVWNTVQREAKGMAKAIVDKYKANPENAHLVMATRRKFGYMIREEIAKLDSTIKVDLSFSESLLETWAVREAFLMFCLLVDPDPSSWRGWFAYKNSADGTNAKSNAPEKNSNAYLKFLTEHSDKITEKAVIDLAIGTKPPVGKGGSNLWDRAKRFVEIRNLNPIDPLKTKEFLNGLFDLSVWPVLDPEEKISADLDMKLALTKVQNILADVKDKSAKLSPIEQLSKVAKILRYQIATKEPFEPDSKSNLQIMTLWGAKGITADHVYVVGLCNEALPGVRRDTYPGTDLDYLEEQRRLFYVSITRAKKTMVLSRSLKIKRYQDKQLGLTVKRPSDAWPRLEMSDFLSDVITFLPKAEDGDTWKGC
jgi:superfamily I DNA/RNA helicase